MKEENDFNLGENMVDSSYTSNENTIKQDGNTMTTVNSYNNAIQTNTISPSSSNIKQKNNTNIIVASILLVMVIIAIGVIGVIYYKDSNNPKNKFLRAVNTYLEKNNIEESNKMFDFLKNGGTINLDGQIKVGADDGTTTANTELFGANIKLIDNKDSQKQYIKLTIDSENEEVFNFEGLSKDNKIYFMLKDIFNNYYYTDFEYIELFSETEQLKTNIMNSLNTYFSEDKFFMTDELITINNKDYNSKKITISLSEKNIYELSKLILENLLKDETSLQGFVTEDMTLKDIKESLKTEIDGINSSISSADAEPIITYNVYLKGNTPLLQEIKIDSIAIKIEGLTEGSIKITDTTSNEELLTGTYNQEELVLNFKNETDNYTITYKHNNQIGDKITSENIVKISGKIEGVDTEIEMSLNVEITKETTIPDINITNAKDINDLSEDEMMSLYGLLMGLIPMDDTQNDDYNYNYDYNYDYDYDYEYNYDNYNYDFNYESYSY